MHTNTAAACLPYVFDRRQDLAPAIPAPQPHACLSPPLVELSVQVSWAVSQRILPCARSYPTQSATGVLRSIRTPGSLCNDPYSSQRSTHSSARPFAALRRRKIPQCFLALPAVHVFFYLRTKPKTTATLANLQLHAHFHDFFSDSALPAGLCSCLFADGVTGAWPDYSGFSGPDGGLPALLPCCMSCS
jgi:hypothetical protein